MMLLAQVAIWILSVLYAMVSRVDTFIRHLGGSIAAFGSSFIALLIGTIGAVVVAMLLLLVVVRHDKR